MNTKLKICTGYKCLYLLNQMKKLRGEMMIEPPLIQLTLELVIGFIAMFVITKLIRKTQINQVTAFDFISAIIFGELLGNAIYDDKAGIGTIIYAVALWGVLMFTVQKVTQKFRRTRKIMDGDPAILVRNGQIDFQVLKREKLDINELLSILRQKDTFSVREIEFAILEPSGNISILKKSKYISPTFQDLNLPEKTVYLPVTLILDGEIMARNLKAVGFNKKWLEKQIHAQGVKKIEEVFYAEWKQDEGIHIVNRNK